MINSCLVLRLLLLQGRLKTVNFLLHERFVVLDSKQLLRQLRHLLLLLVDETFLGARRVVFIDRLHRFLHVFERLNLLLQLFQLALQLVALLCHLRELFGCLLACATGLDLFFGRCLKLFL